MPVYEYACTACGERTEARQSFDDPPLEECPLCGGRLRKLYSPVGIVFKGSGFYATDGRTGSAAAKKATEKKESTDKPDKKGTKPTSSTEKSA
ncbi:MAG: FmdB family zinc ribbon protein [Actinomycetota bacterium]